MLPALALSLLLTAAGPADAEWELAEAVAHLKAFRETKALESLKQARRHAADSPDLLARIQLVTGLAYAQLAQEEQAVAAFSSALTLNPKLEPSEDQLGPKVVEWFNRARAKNGLPPLNAVEEKKIEAPPPVVKTEKEIVYVPAPVEPQKPPSRVPFYFGVGVAAAGVAAAATGIAFGIRSKSALDQSRNEPLVTTSGEAHATAAKNADAANVAFIAAGVLALGGAVIIGVTF